MMKRLFIENYSETYFLIGLVLHSYTLSLNPTILTETQFANTKLQHFIFSSPIEILSKLHTHTTFIKNYYFFCNTGEHSGEARAAAGYGDGEHDWLHALRARPRGLGLLAAGHRSHLHRQLPLLGEY